MDRCALFVDAGYVLADGAMAVHGTRRRESVSWDYPGLVQLLASLAMERSGLPMLRCYWYDATADGQQSAEHDALADLPGVKLRLAKVRPGRRAGVEGEIHRDLTTLARNKAVSDVMVVSAEEDLAQVIADVQDLGMRVSLLHIAVEGNGTVPRALRQECDDVVEISRGHLRPYVELISGAEPPRADEREAPRLALRAPANGSIGTNGRGRGTDGRAHAYVQHDYQQPGASPSQPDGFDAEWRAAWPGEADAVREQPARPQPVTAYRDAGPVTAPAEFGYPADPAQDRMAAAELPVGPDFATPRTDPAGHRDIAAFAEPPPRPEPPVRPEIVGQHELYPAPVAVPGPVERQIAEDAAAQSRGMTDMSGYHPGAVRDQLPREAIGREPAPAAGDMQLPVPVLVPVNSGQVRQLPIRGAQGGQAPVAQPAHGHALPGQPGQPGQLGLMAAPGGQSAAAQPGAAVGQPVDGQPSGPQPAVTPLPMGQPTGYGPASGTMAGGPGPLPPAGPAGPAGAAGPGVPPAPVNPAPRPMPNPLPPAEAAMSQQDAGGPPAVAGPGPEASGPIGPMGPVGPTGPVGPVGPAAYSGGQAGVSLADAVQSAHEEGQEFGESVARDAPALWLEAVLARKPRMPSDLEARLLQGSALPIDYLLHDEVRHALRRGFWDAMERARR